MVKNAQPQGARGENYINCESKKKKKKSKLFIGTRLKPGWLFVIGYPGCYDFVTLRNFQAQMFLFLSKPPKH